MTTTKDTPYAVKTFHRLSSYVMNGDEKVAWCKLESDAVALCQHMNAAYRAGMEADRWIPCSERLPVDNGDDCGPLVQCWHRYKKHPVVARKEWRQGWSPHYWLDANGETCYDMDEITHWQPLPKPPEP